MQLQMVRFDRERHAELVEPLTRILHSAYGALAARGMRYHASHQASSVTLERLLGGESYLAFVAGELAGTITLYAERPQSTCEYYRRSGVYSFGQFAVDPRHQGLGLGARMMDFIERRASERGARVLACDTSERADDLIAMYSRRGYRLVGSTQWDVTNYRSVVLGKLLVSQNSTLSAR